jgi:tetratricopeptide (TPR) repeat protein
MVITSHRFAEAIPVYERSLRLVDDSDTWFNLAISFDQESEGSEAGLRKAINAFKGALRKNPKHSNSLNSLAEYEKRLQAASTP